MSRTPARARPVQSWLDRDPSYRAIARQLDAMVSLQHALQRACPNAPITVAGLDSGTLTVIVPGPAWASRLRQIEPTLLAALAREGPPIERLRIRPRRQMPAQPRPGLPRTPVPAPALDAIATLAGELEDSPLRQALAGLLARQRGRR